MYFSLNLLYEKSDFVVMSYISTKYCIPFLYLFVYIIVLPSTFISLLFHKSSCLFLLITGCSIHLHRAAKISYKKLFCVYLCMSFSEKLHSNNNFAPKGLKFTKIYAFKYSVIFRFYHPFYPTYFKDFMKVSRSIIFSPSFS